MSRPASAVALVIAASVALVGCASSGAAPEPTTTAESVETQTPAPTPEPLVDAYPHDHTIPLALVDDERGSYVHVTVDPDSPLGTFDSSVVDMASLEAAGFTEADAQRAHTQAVRFLVEHALDGTALEQGGTSVEEWFQEHGRATIGWARDAAAFSADGGETLLLAGLMPELPRNGGQRTAITGEVTRISASGEAGGSPMLHVEMAAVAVGPVTDQAMQTWLQASVGDEWESTLQEEYPEVLDFLDGTDDGRAEVNVGMLRLNYTKQGIVNGFISGYDAEAVGAGPEA